MWQAIADSINGELDIDFKVEDKTQLTGGDINLAFKISGNGRDFFVKLNQREQLEQFETEALSLRTLRQHHCIRVPDVVCYGQTIDKAFLVLEYLPLVKESGSGWQQLGQQLALLHQQHEQAMFGFDWDNAIGRTPQPNKWQSNWSTFFSEQRLGWQLQLLLEQGFGFGNIDYLVEQCRQRLAHHQPSPSLLHGDLWRGNVGFLAGSPVIFDPACYYGDQETDVAFTGLFGRFPDTFYQSYLQFNKLPDGYTERKDLYNLYHVLNHAYLFRGSFLVQAQEMIKQQFY
ncbi:fructosamine kinase family protein [Arsukibacterium indicum]|uniref:Fructosamine kinase family protein n=1 Tax=Arsukibacterium indicum TaxID=2848612 RepID=A0ABS6MFF9_9GAMM|nr:fructosamine kinase family protein [Arsukibacterium indicum]MBV2127548.1 fructosamine kinase family protein [Arsukibacterium indicum]